MKRFAEAYRAIFGQPRSILEIGSRDGNEAEDLRLFSDLSDRDVYICEPHPDSFKKICSTFPEFRVFELAISDVPGVKDFNAIPYENNTVGHVGTSSFLKKDLELYQKYGGKVNAENWIKVLAVTGRTLLQLINLPEIDLVKIDTEGTTYEVLKSFGDDLRLLRMIHIEVEYIQVWENQHLADDVHDCLAYYGFERLYYVPKYLEGKQQDSVWKRKD